MWGLRYSHSGSVRLVEVATFHASERTSSYYLIRFIKQFLEGEFSEVRQQIISKSFTLLAKSVTKNCL
jgi:hypothetical protein